MDNPVDSDNTANVKMETLPELSKSSSNLEHMPSQNIWVFGLESELDDISLPTRSDILKHYFFLAARCRNANKMFSYATFTPHVCDKLIQIWNKFNIEVTEKKNIIKKLGRLLKNYREACKRRTKNDAKFREFVDGTTKIFYIGKCKCQLKTARCNCGKIPDRLYQFMLDQCNERIRTIPEYLPVKIEISTVLPPSVHSGASSDPILQPTATENENMSDKPKRPLSAYMIWLNSAREQIKKENPGCKVTDIAKRGGELWRAMKDKSEWEAKAAQAKEDYEEAVKDFEANGGSTANGGGGGGKKRSKPVKKVAKKSKKADSDEEEEDESD